MPLARYQIRNEYSLADPELYRATDKDDPEALLEGVAMASLVGVLRQLGDLAEFAAVVFHDLHEEVMATAARGHGLMARVQQVEAEVPSIEKAFLSQTDQSPFFTNAGIDWHPNLRMEQNLVTRGHLPRFVMNSYEECRGPPRLFLLDKFDLAGAGACLKRYTDPSFCKVEAASSGIPIVDVQREKKIRKVKKKGSLWRNGETTPEGPTSHAKLHQLFLEEHVENGHFDPARLVKLKRRQLNGSPFDLKPGKSYMEKFLGTPSPEHKVVCEVSVNSPPLKLTLDNSSESGLEILEIGIVSPPEKSSQRRESMHSYTVEQEVVLKPLTHELNKENINREIVKVPDSVAGGEEDESPCIIHKMAIDGDSKTEGSLDGDHSDDLMSEVDNYLDALTAMESEMETDNEYKPKIDQGFLKLGKHRTNSDANEEHLEVQANFSDTQSFGNSSISDDGKSSFKKGKSSISYCDSLSNFTENTPSDNEGQVKVSPSENSLPEVVDSPSDTPPVHVETLGTQSGELIAFNNKCIEEDTILNAGEASCSSCLSDSNPLLPPPVPAANSVGVSLEETESDEISSEFIELGPESPEIDQSGTDLPYSSEVISDVPSQIVLNSILKASSENSPAEELDHEDPNVFMHTSNVSDPEKEDYDGSRKEVLQKDYEDGIRENLVEGKTDSPPSVISPSKEQFPCSVLPEIDVDSGVTLVSENSFVEESDREDPNVFMHTSNVSDHEKEDYDGPRKEVLQKDYEDGIRDENLVKEKTDSPPSVISPSKEQFPCSVLPEIDVDSGVTLVSVGSDVVKPVHIDSEIDHVIAATGVNIGNLIGMVETPEVDSSKEHRHSDIAADVSPVEDDLTGVTYSEKNMMKLEEISGSAGGEEIDGFASKVVVQGEHSVPLEHSANYLDNGLDEHVNLEDDVGACPVTSVVATNSTDVVHVASRLSSDLFCSPSSNLVDIQESHSGKESPRQKGLGYNEGVFPGCCTEPVTQNEIKKLEVAPTDLDSSPHEAVSDDHSNLEVLEHVHELALADQTQNCSHVSGVCTVPSSESNDQGLESKHAYLRHSADSSEDALCLPTCYLPEVETSLEHSAELQADKNFAESASAITYEENSVPLFLRSSPHFEEPGVPSKQALELQSDHLGTGCLQEDEAGSKSTDLQSDIHTVSDIVQEKCLHASSKQDAIPNQEVLMQSASQELNDTMPSRNPFDSVFPSFDPLPQNLEEMPPLPPLPPVQWRIGKIQPAPLASQAEWINHGEGSSLPMQPFKADEKSQSDFVSSGREIMQPQNPFLSFTSADIQGSQHLYTESVENSLQPTLLELPTVVSNANCQQDGYSLEGIQSLNPFLTLPEISSEGPEDGFRASGGRLQGSSPDPLTEVATVEHTATERDHVSSHALDINLPDQLTPESILEAKAPEYSMRTSEGEERDSLSASVSTPTILEDQPQLDLEALHGETTWLPGTLALPPTYEVGKPNGSKLPRPRNPLIDAVVAHDKSKMRKVTERVRLQIGPKVDERDSLLEQIRTKSFNLKSTAVTRPSVQGIRGPKTNLKVAAILEKANAIRQALAGSDEDDDTESWSDS